jgi:hypothetical protein
MDLIRYFVSTVKCTGLGYIYGLQGKGPLRPVGVRTQSRIRFNGDGRHGNELSRATI